MHTAKKVKAPTISSQLGNEKGIALVTALILGLIGLLMIVSLLNLVGTGIWTSGSKKRYQTALEAARGAQDFFAKEIIHRGIGGTGLSAMVGMGVYGGIFTNPDNVADTNFNTKLTTMGSYPATPHDGRVSFQLAGAGGTITADTTIRYTSRGNSGTSSNILGGGGVVSNQSGTVTPQHIPYMYQIEIQGQGAGTQENARLSSTYAY